MTTDGLLTILVLAIIIHAKLVAWVLWRDRAPNDNRQGETSRDELRAAKRRIAELTADRNFYARRADARAKHRRAKP